MIRGLSIFHRISCRMLRKKTKSKTSKEGINSLLKAIINGSKIRSWRNTRVLGWLLPSLSKRLGLRFVLKKNLRFFSLKPTNNTSTNSIILPTCFLLALINRSKSYTLRPQNTPKIIKNQRAKTKESSNSRSWKAWQRSKHWKNRKWEKAIIYV